MTMRAETMMPTDQQVLAMAEAIQTEIELDDRMDAKVRDFNDIEIRFVAHARWHWAYELTESLAPMGF